MSIQARIILFGLTIVLVILTCSAGGSYALLAAVVQPGQDEELGKRARAAVAQVDQLPAGDLAAARPGSPARPLTPVRPALDNDVFVLVLDADGAPISYSGGPAPAIPAAVLAQARSQGNATATVAIDGVPVRIAVRPWQRADLRTSGFVVAAQARRRTVTDLRGVLVVLLFSVLITLVAAAVAIWLVVRRALRPLRQLTATADEIGRSPDRTRRLPPATRADDLGRLTESFNGMLDRLAEAHTRTTQALSAQQRFVADASHELRTPLTTIRNNVGFLRARPDADPADRASALSDLDAEAVRMTRLVEDLLTLARADGGAPIHPSTVDIGALAHDICRTAGAQHPDRTIHCAGPPTVLRGDADALARLLWILLDNAVKYTSAGGQIWVAVTSRGAEGVTLEVADDGAGIPPGEEMRIFARFHQADPARRQGGAGLGLSIASWIAHAHHGTISAATNERGGATFTVRISSIS
jgi:signal transduction histidine kinase